MEEEGGDLGVRVVLHGGDFVGSGVVGGEVEELEGDGAVVYVGWGLGLGGGGVEEVEVEDGRAPSFAEGY